MQSVLDRKGVLLTLGDQDAGQRGLFVDFFGRPASTHKAIAVFALQFNVPLMVTTSTRLHSGAYGAGPHRRARRRAVPLRGAGR